jgi:hypothetical protein
MSTEQTESTTQLPAAVPQQPAGQQPTGTAATAEWGAPPPPPTAPKAKWTVKRTAVAVAVAVGIAAAGGAAIYAASGSATNEQGGGPGGMGGPGGGRVMMGGPMSDLTHGEFQTGEVTEISDTSITVKSEDDYSQTYTIDNETQLGDDIATGDEVTVIATTEGSTTTAESILEMGTMPQNRNNGGTGGNGGPPNGTPPTGTN